MITTTQNIARLWHGSQMYGALPYYKHLDHVEAKVVFLYPEDGDLELLRLTAILHDLFEDTECNEQDLRSSIGRYNQIDQLISALDAITKRENESRENYLVRCAENTVALKVKVADTLCNLECSIRTCEPHRISRYTKQINRLIELKKAKEN